MPKIQIFGTPAIRRFSLDKMRRNMARNTPDAVWATFDRYDETIDKQITSWRVHWAAMMRIKHGRRLKDYTTFQSEMVDPRKLRFQLVANLWPTDVDPTKELMDSGIFSPNAIRRSLGLKEL